jgi:hypothetical protein
MAGFGTPLSSIPNTSYLNVSSPVSSAGFTGSPTSSFKPTGMDPFSIGLGVASIGTSIAGLFGQKSAAEKQAEATEEAARIAAASTEKAAKIGAEAQIAGKLGGFGLDYLTSRYEGGAGGALNRINAARDFAQRANLEANNPSAIALRSVQRYDERLRGAMPGYMPPSNLFV